MTEEIVAIKIIGDGFSGSGGSSSSSGSSSVGGAGGMLKGMGGMLKGVMSALGIGSVIGIVVMIAGNLKSLMNIVGSIIKMISYLVKPIADVVMILLMPILLMLKPIVVMVNQIMAPFIKLSMQLMREGMTMMGEGNMVGGGMAMGAATQVIMNGLSSVIVALSGNLVNMLIELSGQMMTMMLQSMVGIIGALFGGVLGAFGVDVESTVTTVNDWIANAIGLGTEELTLGIDAIFGELMAVFAGQSAFLGEMFGINTNEFATNALKNITNIFDGAEGLTQHWANIIGMGQGFGGQAGAALTTLWGEDGLGGELTTGLGEFQETGVSAIGNAVSAFNKEWDNMKTSSSGRDWNDMMNEANQQSVDLTRPGATYNYGGG